jgi:hypothetical protein
MIARTPVSIALAAAASLVSACTTPPTNYTPWNEPGFGALETFTDPPFPDHSTGYAAVLATPVTGSSDVPAFHNWAHSRGYVLAPIGKVYQALQDPNASRLSTGIDQWTATMNVEDYPISFEIHYVSLQLGGSYHVRWDLLYRGGITQTDPATGAPTEVILEYKRISGDTHLRLESGSIVATPAPDDPNVTYVELVCWLDADTTDQSTVAGTVRDWNSQLTKVVNALP